jgi:hypothetical protein
MKVSKFSEQQITVLLKQVDDGVSVEEVCRKAGISQQTYYRWRKKYGGLMPSEVHRPSSSACRHLGLEARSFGTAVPRCRSIYGRPGYTLLTSCGLSAGDMTWMSRSGYEASD